MPRITDVKADYQRSQHEKTAERYRLANLKNRSLKCKLGFHFPYNSFGYPMIEVEPRCFWCEEKLETIETKTHIYTVNGWLYWKQKIKNLITRKVKPV
jgi:hypothetical protein